MCIHSATLECQDALATFLSLFNSAFELPPDFEFTTAQLLRNASVSRHVDKNPTDSTSFTCGAFTGGQLVIDDVEHDLKYKPLRFDGSRPHFVKPFSDGRWSVVLYPHHRASELQTHDLERLRRLVLKPTLPPKLHQSLERRRKLRLMIVLQLLKLTSC